MLPFLLDFLECKHAHKQENTNYQQNAVLCVHFGLVGGALKR